MLTAAQQPRLQQAALAPRRSAVAQRQQRQRQQAQHHQQQLHQQRRRLVAARAEPNGSSSQQAQQSEPAAPAAPPARSTPQEQVFFEGSASNAELIISLLLAATLVYIPITVAVIGKKLWITYRFTDRRVQVINTSPLFARTIEIPYSKISEVRTAPRAFGLWGDMVIFLRDGSRLELTGLEAYKEVKAYIEGRIST